MRFRALIAAGVGLCLGCAPATGGGTTEDEFNVDPDELVVRSDAGVVTARVMLTHPMGPDAGFAFTLDGRPFSAFASVKVNKGDHCIKFNDAYSDCFTVQRGGTTTTRAWGAVQFVGRNVLAQWGSDGKQEVGLYELDGGAIATAPSPRPAGDYHFDYGPLDGVDFTVAAGRLEVVTLNGTTKRAVARLVAPERALPTASCFARPGNMYISGRSNRGFDFGVRDQSTLEIGRYWSTGAPIGFAIRMDSLAQPWPLVPKADGSFDAQLQRLDVDHPVMTKEDGTQIAVPGSWLLFGGNQLSPNCSLPTGSGLDVPPGTYEVRTTFWNPETNQPITTSDWVTLPSPTSFPVTVVKQGSGIGSVTSTPAGLDCGPGCTSSSATFSGPVTLFAVPGLNSRFAGWLAPYCSGTGPCTFTPTTGTVAVVAMFETINVAVNFVVDDTANKSFRAGELAWKGSFRFDPATRILVKDASWTGPFPLLWDDGPWTQGGHEPRSAIAGDNRWGVTVFVNPPPSGTEHYEYGAHELPGQWWIWRGANGMLALDAGATGELTAPGMSVPAFGTTDIKVVIDHLALAPAPAGVAWDMSSVRIVGSAWSWRSFDAWDNGAYGDDHAADSQYTFALGASIGTNATRNLGLAHPGETVTFMPVLGGIEYKGASGSALTLGVTAYARSPGGTWQAISLTSSNNGIVMRLP